MAVVGHESDQGDRGFHRNGISRQRDERPVADDPSCAAERRIGETVGGRMQLL